MVRIALVRVQGGPGGRPSPRKPSQMIGLGRRLPAAPAPVKKGFLFLEKLAFLGKFHPNYEFLSLCENQTFADGFICLAGLFCEAENFPFFLKNLFSLYF